jgi:biopolymer transport protein ExbB/TolQ
MTRYRVNSKEFFAQVKKLVLAGNIDRAIKLCEADDYPILQLVKAGLTHANKGPDEIDASLSEKLSELKPQSEKRIGALWSLANIATLIGLLGTVSGLIGTFGAIAAPGLSQSDKQRMLSNGIAEAMYNTALGLGIAVFCMITHIILHTRSKTIQHDLEGTMERTFNMLTIQKTGQY